MSVVFVFGSNLRGIHGAGAAKEANLKWGAEWGVAEGRTGDAYAIPTKSAGFQTLPWGTIESSVTKFLVYAKKHPEDSFLLTAIGTGLAGLAPFEVKDMMGPGTVPENVFISGRLWVL
jgi:hypothetical protein